MPRIQGLAESGILTGSKLLKEGQGEVHSLTIAWVGAQVGDVVCYLIDAVTDSGNPADNEVIIVAPTASGTFQKEWPQGKRFDVGIFYKEGQAANVYAELTFK